MLDDTDTTIDTIGVSPEEFKRSMICIAESVSDRHKETEWAQNLRFLTPALVNLTEGRYSASDLDEVDDPCSCNEYGSKPFKDSDHHLMLTKREDCPGCVHYLAVSYCWSSIGDATSTGVQYSVMENGQSRKPRCPPALLERVILYAAYYEYDFIWIDQECIDQTNAVDQSTGIQAMDLVYQQANSSIAVLQACISEQRHYDAICGMLGSDGSYWGDQQLIDLLEALELIMRDPWFERAWTLQESTSGTRQMCLFVRLEKSLELLGDHSFVPVALLDGYDTDYMELDLSTLHEILSSWLMMQIDSDSRDNIGPETTQRANAFLEKWLDTMVPETSTTWDPDTRIICNASEALSYMSTRRNSVVSDRLAILANLCNYSVRVNTIKLDTDGHGLSMCAITLSVLNGDWSLVTGYQDYRDGKRGRTTPFALVDQRKMPHGFTWSLPANVSLKNLPFLDKNTEILRMKTLSLSSNGLELRGCIWIADGSLDLRIIRAQLIKQYGSDLSTAIKPDRQRWWFSTPKRRVRVTMAYQLLSAMHTRGYIRLADHLFQILRRRATSKQLSENPDLQPYTEANFQTIFDIESQRLKWPTPIPFIVPKDRVEDPWHVLGDSLSEWLLDKVLNEDSLEIARPMCCTATADSYSAFFFGTRKDDLIFSPLNNFGPQNPEGVYTWYPANWKVERVEPTPATFRCNSLLAGLWRAEHTWLENVFLA